MKNRLSFLTLGFVGILIFTPSCGADEGTSDGGGGDDGSGTPCSDLGTPSQDDRQCREGRICADVDGDMDDLCEAGETCQCIGVIDGTGGTGSGGTNMGGSSGSTIGGSAGSTGGTGGPAPVTNLGEPCATDADCGEAPIFCLLPNGLTDGSGPPNGMCTVPCQLDDVCLEYADAAVCVAFEEDENMMLTSTYCVLSCVGGPAGVPKCRSRDDFACGILDTIPGTTPCTMSSECPVGDICFEDVCQEMVTACRPTCRADSDCADGQFCNFANGFCVAEEPPGLAIGALCDPSLPPEQDECNGFCIPTDDTETQGTCTAFCSVDTNAYGCGWVGDSTPDAACLFATIISRNAAGGVSPADADLALCGSLCDCNDDCPADAEFCMDENASNSTASIMANFGRQGYCRPLIDTEGETEADSFDTCPAASQ